MIKLIYQGEEIPVTKEASVLQLLLEAGHQISNSCQAGICQSCMMRGVKGYLPPASQKGLKESLKAQGFFLACCCYPESDLTVGRPDFSAYSIGATVTSLEKLAPRVLRIRFKPKEEFLYVPGQYITLWRDLTEGRSYSLASVPALDEEIEIQVARSGRGGFSDWLHHELKVGEIMRLQGPLGTCFYTEENRDQTLLLVGTGTGLSPLYGILRDALHRGHRGPIHLCHGARIKEDLYLKEELKALELTYANFHYHPLILEDNGQEEAPTDSFTKKASMEDFCKSLTSSFQDWRAYICGHPKMVTSISKQIFLGGASLKNIYSDSFLAPAGQSFSLEDRKEAS